MPAGDPKSKFAVFRRSEMVDFDASEIMSSSPPTETELAGSKRAVEQGVMKGAKNDLIFAGGGFSLARVWFKSGFPLPRHSHDTACLYYITAGSLRIGTEELGPGDGFLVGADVPYTYTPGDNGVELLEFRAADEFGIRMLADNPAFWDRAIATATERQDKWREEKRPSER